MKKIIALMLTVFILATSTISFSSCDDDSSDGGNCKYCGTHTNWTYTGGGYVCWACDH